MIPPSKSYTQVELWLLAVGLFATLFLWDVEIPFGELGTAPVWVGIAPLTMLPVLIRHGGLPKALLVGVVIAVTLVLHQVVVLSFQPDVPFIRVFVNGAILSVSVGLFYALLQSTRTAMISALMNAIYLFLAVQFAVMCSEIVLDIRLFTWENAQYYHYFLPILRPTGFFGEPSHVAAAITIPITLFVGFTGVWFKKLGWIPLGLLFGIIFLCPSATLIVAFAVAFLVRAITSRGGAAVSAVVAGLTVAIAPGIIYANRQHNELAIRLYDTWAMLTGQAAATDVNLSSLLLAKASYIARRTLEDSPIGYGYDNTLYASNLYGREFTEYFYAVNAEDLGTILAKITVEFGWLGFASVLWIIVILAKSVYISKRGPLAIWSGLLLAQLLLNITRSSGYFYQGSALIVATGLYLTFEMGGARLRRVNRVRRASPPLSGALEIGVPPSG